MLMQLKAELMTKLALLDRHAQAQILLREEGPIAEAGIVPQESVALLAYILWLARWTTQHGPLLNGRFPSEQWTLVGSRARTFNTTPDLLTFCHQLWGSHKSGLGVPFTSLRDEDGVWIREVSVKLGQAGWKKLRTVQNINEALTYGRFLDEMFKCFPKEKA